MTRLGIRELELLRSCGTHSAMMMGCALAETRVRIARLVRLGLMELRDDGCLAVVTPAGLRALAAAVEGGRISLFELKKDQKS